MLRPDYVFGPDPTEKTPEDIKLLVRDCECAPLDRTIGDPGTDSGGSVDPGTTGGSLDPPLDPFDPGNVDDGSGIGETGLDPVIEPPPEEECSYDSYTFCGTTSVTDADDIPTCYIKVQPDAEGGGNPSVIFVQSFGTNGVCMSKGTAVACDEGVQGYILGMDEYVAVNGCDTIECSNTPPGADYYRFDLCTNSPGGVNATPRSILIPVSYITGSHTNLTYLYNGWCYLGSTGVVSSPVDASETIPAIGDLTSQTDCSTESCTCCEVAAIQLATAVDTLKRRIQFVNGGLIPVVAGHGASGEMGEVATDGWNKFDYILNVTPLNQEGDCEARATFYLTYIVELEYWIDTLYASGVWLDTNTYLDADIEGVSGALDYFSGADYTHQTLPLPTDIEFCTFFQANMTAINLAIQLLEAVTVAASQVEISGKSTEATGDTASGADCMGIANCALAQLVSTSFGAVGVNHFTHYTHMPTPCLNDSDTSPGVPGISKLFKFSSTGAPNAWTPYTFLIRGKIQANLTAYPTGSPMVYLMLGPYTPNPFVIFGQTRPTGSAASTWGKWSEGSMAPGGLTTTGYVTHSDDSTEFYGDCDITGSYGSGWQVDNQIVVLHVTGD